MDAEHPVSPPTIKAGSLYKCWVSFSIASVSTARYHFSNAESKEIPLICVIEVALAIFGKKMIAKRAQVSCAEIAGLPALLAQFQAIRYVTVGHSILSMSGTTVSFAP